MNRRALYLAFNKLCLKLRRSGELLQYLAVLETTAGTNGCPPLLHLHVLASGSYIRQSRLSELWAWATDGKARVTDIRAVRGVGDDSAAGYLVKQLAYYCTKSQVAQLEQPAGGRSRPVRCSRGWLPGGFTAAEKAVAQLMAEEQGRDPDPGPWLFVSRRGDGSLSVRQNAGEQALAVTDDDGAAPPGAATEEEKADSGAEADKSLATVT